MKTQDYFLELGKMNTLKIDRLTTPGAYLMAQDGNDVLLPGQYLTQEMKEGDLVDVFLYTDSEDRLVATTQRPKAKLDEAKSSIAQTDDEIEMCLKKIDDDLSRFKQAHATLKEHTLKPTPSSEGKGQNKLFRWRLVR